MDAFEYIEGIRQPNSIAQYPDADRQTLLQIYTARGELGTGTTFLSSDMSGKEDPNLLKNGIEAKLSAGSDLILCNLSITSPTGNRDTFNQLTSHAVGLIVDVRNRKILYADPYGIAIDQREEDKYKPEELLPLPNLRHLLEGMNLGFEIESSALPLQQDKCSCAPLTAHMLRHYAMHNKLPTVVDLSQVRAEQFRLLHDSDHRKRNARAESNYQGLIMAVGQAVESLPNHFIIDPSDLDGLKSQLIKLFKTWRDHDPYKLSSLNDLVSESASLSMAGLQVAKFLEEQCSQAPILVPKQTSMVDRVSGHNSPAELKSDIVDSPAWQETFLAKLKSAASIKLTFKSRQQLSQS